MIVHVLGAQDQVRVSAHHVDLALHFLEAIVIVLQVPFIIQEHYPVLRVSAVAQVVSVLRLISVPHAKIIFNN